MKTILYAITSIDSEGKKVLLSKKCNIATLNEQPFYQSYENARKSSVKIKNDNTRNLDRTLHWKVKSEETLSKMKRGKIEFNEGLKIHANSMIKDYFDSLSFIDNGFNIVEVKISL